MKDTTILFLIKKDKDRIIKICLAMKKRGLGVGKWNGIGGKKDESLDKNINQTAKRETLEEIRIEVKEMTKIATLSFFHKDKPEWNQRTSVFFCDKWEGDPKETEEMAPKWFDIKDIPYDKMWPDDFYWLPLILKGDILKGRFNFIGNGVIRKLPD